MNMKNAWIKLGLLAMGAASTALFVFSACSSDSDAPMGAGSSASSTGGANTSSSSSSGTPQMEASTPGQYVIPASGGTFSFTGATTALEFTFPASAAGRTVNLSRATAADIGWADGTFSDVIKMDPDGTTFTDPVIVKPANNQVLLFSTHTGAKSTLEALTLNAAGTGLQLRHFSALVLVPAGKQCDSTSGWSANANHVLCQHESTKKTLLNYTCKGYSFCTLINAHCCVDSTTAATRQDCQLGDSDLYVDTKFSNNGGSVTYCVPPNDAGSPNCPTITTTVGDAGASSRCSGSLTAASGDQWKVDCNDPSFATLDAGSGPAVTCVCSKNSVRATTLSGTVDCSATTAITAAMKNCVSSTAATCN